jgi:hypothetical protein
MASGNLSFLNWLTIVPALACFDDGFWSKILPRPLVRRATNAIRNEEPSRPMVITSWVITIIIAILSIQPVFNILSPRQIMNTSFDPLDLVNTYGAFGSVGRERLNIIFEGTNDEAPGEKTKWIAYPYKGLPVDLYKQPPQIAPYQLRLDWQIWFASMSTADEYPWTLNLVSKLLYNDPGAISLFAGNPFPEKPPRFVRVVLYRYSFAKPGNPDGQYWNRERISDDWIPAMSENDPRLTEFLKGYGWLH